MSNELPVNPLPVSPKPPRNLAAKLVMILMFVVGGIAVVLTAYYVAENYPIFGQDEEAPVQQEIAE